MNASDHHRAQQLILEASVEDVAPANRRWLDAHLGDCARCAALARSTAQAIGTLRSVSVEVDPALISRTRLRVLLRARQLGPAESRHWALWISCALSWTLGVASAPLVWRAFAWLGETARLPALVWQLGFALWWAVPAGAALALVAWHKSRADETDAAWPDWKR